MPETTHVFIFHDEGLPVIVIVIVWPANHFYLIWEFLLFYFSLRYKLFFTPGIAKRVSVVPPIKKAVTPRIGATAFMLLNGYFFVVLIRGTLCGSRLFPCLLLPKKM